MSKPSATHLERTAAEPRQSDLHRATICYVRNVNPRIRLLRLALPYAVKFYPGQWLDLQIPALPNHTGGFTITSTPADASENPRQNPSVPKQQNRKLVFSPRPHLELAVQNSPANPSAAWLWRKESDVLGKTVQVRVGGSFVWPPATKNIHTAVFVAGGVGINPLVSMISHIAQAERPEVIPETVKLLYSTHRGHGDLDQILFFPRLKQIFQTLNPGTEGSNTFDIHLTDDADCPKPVDFPSWLTMHNSRITHQQLVSAVGPISGRSDGVVAYVCGPPTMTDEFVEVLRAQEGMKDKVFCEKWW